MIRNTIMIDASPAEVWDVLTNPMQTKKYMFGCEPVSSWKLADPLLWKGIFDGREVVAVKGNILDIQKYQSLAYSVFDPNSPIEDIPENYTVVTYCLSASNGTTELVVTQGDFSKVADGEMRYAEATGAGGWGPLLQQIKDLAENPS